VLRFRLVPTFLTIFHHFILRSAQQSTPVSVVLDSCLQGVLTGCVPASLSTTNEASRLTKPAKGFVVSSNGADEAVCSAFKSVLTVTIHYGGNI